MNVISILLVGLVIVIFCVFPVMFIAKKLGAENAGLLRCFVAIIVGSFVSSLFVFMIPGAAASPLLAGVYSILITGLVYKFILESTYIAGVLTAFLPAVFYFFIDVIYQAIFS